MPQNTPLLNEYGENPLLPISLNCANNEDREARDATDQAKEMVRLHKVIQDNINKTSEKYKLKTARKRRSKKPLEIGELVWVYLRKDRFP